ncbi:hypothetical protein PBAL39_01947 [Pedobacter sp. BAL39]|nr:hypothetical protein PBAL39_01947 [Pedobacter sp. BAL39]
MASLSWLKLWRAYRRNARVVLWIPEKSFRYLCSDAFVWDAATIAGLLDAGVSFRIVAGLNIGHCHHKAIFYTISNRYNVFGFDDYTDVLQHITNRLEAQGNMVFPKNSEAVFWENKAHMHHLFRSAKVHEPRTTIFKGFEALLSADLTFPFLIKAEHSCSSEGLYKIDSWSDLADLVSNDQFVMENKNIIVQELINMRKDLRVILVKEDIVLHYWRINTAEEWKPTSTSYGSKVDFDFFPEQWRAHIIDTFKSLKLTTGAFDITWANDDLATEPIYLEVSPFYQPNPPMVLKEKAYAFYKQNFSFRNSWDVKYVDVVFSIKSKQVKAYLDDAPVG